MDKEQFLKNKKKVLKKYPNAKTMMDNNGKFSDEKIMKKMLQDG